MIFVVGGVAAVGAGVGAVAEFFYDPVLGPERRLLVKNKLGRNLFKLRKLVPEAVQEAVDVKTVEDATEGVTDVGKHVQNRVGGLLS